MRVKARDVTESARLIGWVLVIFSLTRMYAIADVFATWREASDKYYVQDRRRLMSVEYGRDEKIRDSVMFGRASEMVVMGTVMKHYGDEGNSCVTVPTLCAGIAMLMVAGLAGNMDRKSKM